MSKTNDSRKPFVVFDIETTGPDASSDEIVSFAAVVLDGDKVVDTLSFLVKPSRPIPADATKIHGISNEAVEDKPAFVDYAERVYDLFSRSDVGGYNVAKFDIPIVDRQLTQCGKSGAFDNSFIYDAFVVYKKHATRTLTDALKYYTGKPLEGAHDALADVNATLDIIRAQLEIEKGDIRAVSEQTMPKPSERVGTTSHVILQDGKHILNFTRHKGTPLDQCEKSLLTWITNQPFVPKETKAIVKKYLK